MNIGFASQISLQLMRHLVTNGADLPSGYQFAPAADWVIELANRGHHITLYTTAREIDAPKSFYGDNITIRIASQRTRGTGRDFFAMERDQLKQMMIADRCDLIHAHWTYQFALAALASDIPTLITIHDLPWNVLIQFRDLHRVARLLMAYEVAFRGRHFTAVSQDAATHFRRYLNPMAKITVVPNGLPDTIFEAGLQSVRRNKSETVFATVLQGWSRGKNATTALRAFQIARREIQGARLLMFGVDYEPGGEANRWAIQQKLDQNVTFVGLLTYGELLRRVGDEADIVVHPSLDESFSMAVLEAMALRKPVIAGKSTPGVREVLGFGKNGVLTDVTSPEAIAEAMKALATDLDYRHRMAELGYNRAFTQYRLGAVMSKYEGLYQSILQN